MAATSLLKSGAICCALATGFAGPARALSVVAPETLTPAEARQAADEMIRNCFAPPPAAPFGEGPHRMDLRGSMAATLCSVARGYYRSAAERGDVEAMFGLARVYGEGVGVTPDPARAEEWLRKAQQASGE